MFFTFEDYKNAKFIRNTEGLQFKIVDFCFYEPKSLIQEDKGCQVWLKKRCHPIPNDFRSGIIEITLLDASSVSHESFVLPPYTLSELNKYWFPVYI